jgi:phosphomevalonate kinase
MLSGEYAVLHGAPAVVAAVDRRAFAQLGEPDGSKVPAEASAAYREAQRSLGLSGAADPRIDVSQLRAEGSKLGLGSSAAAAAAAAGLVFAGRGEDISAPAVRARIFGAALRGHRAISPEGSGADVASSVHGGFLRFQRNGESVDVQPIAWPRQLRARVVWTRQEARTSNFIERVNALAKAEPARHRTLIDSLGQEAERFVEALRAGEPSAVLKSTAVYGQAMGRLGEAAGIPIVTDTLRRVAELAAAAGGAAKPSGAGGGDVALALFPDMHSDQVFAELCREQNFTLLLLELGAAGVSAGTSLDGHEGA